MLIYRMLTLFFAGQYFQTVYRPDVLSLSPYMHLTDADVNGSDHNLRTILYSQWRPFWHVHKPVLLEKSPRHIGMLRLLQHWFTARNTYVIVVVKHPLGPFARTWADVENRANSSRNCGEMRVIEWLTAMDMVVEDFKHIRHKAVVYLEDMARANTQGLFDHQLFLI